MIINFSVNNQKLERNTNDIFLADKSNNIIQCSFLFSGEDWIGKQRFVLLHNYQCQTYQLHLDETNTIIVPYDILIKEKFSICLYGEDETEERITTNMVTLHLAPSGYTTDIEDLHDINPDIWTQIWNAIDGKSNIGHVHVVADITDFPATMPPSSHTHKKADITDFQHSHTVSQITDFPYIPSKISDLTNDSDFVEKSNTHGLLKNDGTVDTTTYVNTNDSRLSDTRNPKPHTHAKNQITDFPVLANVATSGSYNDLSNKPVIPSKISDLTDDSDFISKNNTPGLVKNDGTIDTTQYLSEHQDISGKVNYTDIVDNLTTNDSEKPLSAKQGKQLADMIGEIQLYVNR